ELSHERDAVFSGGGRENARTAPPRELHGDHPDVAARAVHDDRLIALDVKRVVHALQGRQADDRQRAGVLEIELTRHASNSLRRYGRILGVEPAVLVVEDIRPNPVAASKTRNTAANFDDHTCAIRPGYQRKPVLRLDVACAD